MQEDMAAQNHAPDSISTTDWILILKMNSGFLIETFILFLTRPDRIQVWQMVRKAGQHPTLDEIQGIAWRRRRIASRIKDFHTSSNRLLGANNVAAVFGTGDILNDDGYVSDETC